MTPTFPVKTLEQEQLKQHIVQNQDESQEQVAVSQKIATYMANKVSVTFWKGDFSAFEMDAIVIAANESLSHMGRLAKVLSATGGCSIQAESDVFIAKNVKLKTGQVASLQSKNTLNRRIPQVLYFEMHLVNNDDPTVKEMERAFEEILLEPLSDVKKTDRAP